MIPVEVGEGHHDLLLLVANREQILPQIPDSGARVDDRDAVGVRERELQAGGIAAELLESGIADGDGAPGSIKFKLHTGGIGFHSGEAHGRGTASSGFRRPGSWIVAGCCRFLVGNPRAVKSNLPKPARRKRPNRTAPEPLPKAGKAGCRL